MLSIALHSIDLEAPLCIHQVAKLEEQLSRLMQSMPPDVTITPNGATPQTPPTQHSSPSLAKTGRRRSAFELVRGSSATRILTLITFVVVIAMSSQAWPRQSAGAALLKAGEKLLDDTVLTTSWAHLH